MSSDCCRWIVLDDSRGGATTVAAKVVVAADGLGSQSTAKTKEFTTDVRRNGRIGLGATFDDCGDEFPLGSIHMHTTRSGYVGLVRMEDRRLHIAAAVEPKFIREFDSPHQAIGSMLREPAWWPKSIEMHHAWQGTPPLTRTVHCPAARRILLIGDAAGYVEPFTGEGIAWALEGAVAVEPFVVRGVQRWDSDLEQEWLRHYLARIRARQYWCRWFTDMLRHPMIARTAMLAFTRLPGLTKVVARRILGT